ncbi:MAG TPA: hypothetical protein VK400_04300, partial [Pyrinomonadaceae bacterium]|nr:hypothetical protein [Pyrinomonadaceae bacterium]
MLELSPKSFEEFLKAAQGGNVVPVVRSVLADLHTPVSAFVRLSGDAERAFLFESIEGGERLARYSFLAANPYLTVRARGKQTIIEQAGEAERAENTPVFDYLREHFRRNRLARRANLPPLCGGAVGFLTYDAVRLFEPTLDEGKEFEKDDA